MLPQPPLLLFVAKHGFTCSPGEAGAEQLWSLCPPTPPPGQLGPFAAVARGGGKWRGHAAVHVGEGREEDFNIEGLQ